MSDKCCPPSCCNSMNCKPCKGGTCCCCCCAATANYKEGQSMVRLQHHVLIKTNRDNRLEVNTF